MPTQKFLVTRDNVRIAYSESGSGPCLVYVRGWMSHLDALWERPGFRAFIQTLSEHYHVVRYDMRGNGLSERQGVKISLELMVSDLEDLIDHLQLDRFVLWAASFGGPTGIAYACRHPERVEYLILDGTYARGAKIARPMRRLLLVLALRFFPEMAFSLLSNATVPETNRSGQKTLDLGSRMVTPKTGAQLYRLAFKTDVTRMLSKIQSPTLVMHALQSRSISPRLGRELAGLIPAAQFVGLDTSAQNSWEGDQVQMLKAVGAFLGVKLVDPALDLDPGSATADRAFIFVSYSHTDSAEVLALTSHLQATGFNMWVDTGGIKPGKNWREEIAVAVQVCRGFVLCVSEAALQSDHCLRELNFALDERRPILVVFLEPVTMPASMRMSLASRQAIYRYKLEETEFKQQLAVGLQEIMREAGIHSGEESDFLDIDVRSEVGDK